MFNGNVWSTSNKKMCLRNDYKFVKKQKQKRQETADEKNRRELAREVAPERTMMLCTCFLETFASPLALPISPPFQKILWGQQLDVSHAFRLTLVQNESPIDRSKNIKRSEGIGILRARMPARNIKGNLQLRTLEGTSLQSWYKVHQSQRNIASHTVPHHPSRSFFQSEVVSTLLKYR